MDVKQFKKHLEAHYKREMDSIRIADRLNHTLGYYIRAACCEAFGGGKCYPKKPLLAEKEKQTSDDMSRIGMMYTIALGGEIRNVSSDD